MTSLGSFLATISMPVFAHGVLGKRASMLSSFCKPSLSAASVTPMIFGACTAQFLGTRRPSLRDFAVSKYVGHIIAWLSSFRMFFHLFLGEVYDEFFAYFFYPHEAEPFKLYDGVWL